MSFCFRFQVSSGSHLSRLLDALTLSTYSNQPTQPVCLSTALFTVELVSPSNSFHHRTRFTIELVISTSIFSPSSSVRLSLVIVYVGVEGLITVWGRGHRLLKCSESGRSFF